MIKKVALAALVLGMLSGCTAYVEGDPAASVAVVSYNPGSYDYYYHTVYGYGYHPVRYKTVAYKNYGWYKVNPSRYPVAKNNTVVKNNTVKSNTVVKNNTVVKKHPNNNKSN